MKTCSNFLMVDRFENSDMICKQHECAACGKKFKVGDTKVAKCLICEKAFCYDYDQEKLDAHKNVSKILRR